LALVAVRAPSGHYAPVSRRATARDYGWISVAAIASLMLLGGLFNVAGRPLSTADGSF
jgi:hypothetical protein